jgi:2'-5' RNA ligase
MTSAEPPGRLFLAIDLPARVATRLARLVPAGPGVRPVAIGQMHLTLHFLGSLGPAALASTTAAAAAVGWQGFGLELAGGGRFPNRGAATVLWVGARTSPPLERLHAALAAALRAAGQAVETRPFVPHVTVARLDRRAGWETVAAFLRAAAAVEPIGFAVERFHLIASEPAPAGRGAGGRIHTVLRTFPQTY